MREPRGTGITGRHHLLEGERPHPSRFASHLPRDCRPHPAEDLIRRFAPPSPERGRQVRWTVFQALDAPEPRLSGTGEGIMDAALTPMPSPASAACGSGEGGSRSETEEVVPLRVNDVALDS